MLIGFTGIGTTTYLFSTITAFILETNVNPAYRRRRMECTITAMSGHYIVCGIGRVGSYIADELIKTERPFVAIDVNEQIVEAHCKRTGNHIFLLEDASDDDMLLSADVERCRGVFAVSGDDSKNLVISLSARQLNPSVRIVARVHDPRNAEKTRRAGADESWRRRSALAAGRRRCSRVERARLLVKNHSVNIGGVLFQYLPGVVSAYLPVRLRPVSLARVSGRLPAAAG
jgi:hypothetical protein